MEGTTPLNVAQGFDLTIRLGSWTKISWEYQTKEAP